MPIGYTPDESAEQLPTAEVAFQNGIQQLGLVDKPSEGGSFTNDSVGSYGSALTSASTALSALRAIETIRDEILVSEAAVEANLLLAQENLVSTTAQRVLAERDAVSAQANEDNITSLTTATSTVDAGGVATSDYNANTGVLTLGIPRGDLGNTGSQGPIGIRGLQGETGAPSTAIGPTGVQGPVGPIGPIGGEGPRGHHGTEGDPGDQGIRGPEGEVGAASTVEGPRGLVGPIGPTGPIGPIGPSGATSGLFGPELTYAANALTRIDYDGGEFKVFSYNGDGTLNTIALTVDGVITTKTLNYTNGVLISITEA